MAKKRSKLTLEETADAKSHQHLAAHVVYETVRREGDQELARPAVSLVWSGIAAGLGIGFSVVGMALLHVYLPDAPWRPIVSSFGYCTGFIIVILARQQLFTENTITAVLPVLAERTRKNLLALVRLWSIVFAANMVGTSIFAAALATNLFFPPEAMEGFRSISTHVMELGAESIFFRGIIAGWLIATLVWLLPTADKAELWVIIIITYLVQFAGLTHVIAGSVEAFFLVAIGETSPLNAIFVFLIPCLIGNMIGGTALFALISYAQVSEEI